LACLPLNLVYWGLYRRVARPAVRGAAEPAAPQAAGGSGPRGGLRRSGAALAAFIRAQTVLDVAIVTVLVYLTGGVGSNLIFLYFGPILAASSLLGLPASLLAASFSAIAVSLVTLMHFFAFVQGVSLPLVTEAWRPSFPATARAVPFALLYDPPPGLLTQAVSFYLVAVLSGTLAGRLRQLRIASARILDRLQEGVLTVDAAGRVVFLNRRARELLRVPAASSVVGRPWEQVVPEQLHEPLTRSFAALRSSEAPSPRSTSHGLTSPQHRADQETTFRRGELADSPAHFEASLTPADEGSPGGRGQETASIPVQVVSSPLTDDRGRLRGANVIFIDLSERKRMEAALRQAERLEALNQAAAGIAHEIRNPIASIRASAQELLAESEFVGAEAATTSASPGPGRAEPIGSEPGRTEPAAAGMSQPGGPQPRSRASLRTRLLRVLLLESDRLNGIVTDFLAYARLRPPAPETFPLAEVLERVALLLEKQAAPHHRISVQCPAELSVEADREQLVQVFLNLGLNALEAMREGGTVTVEAERGTGSAAAGSWVVVSVGDEGPGIAPERMERIFEPFFTTKERGTGMGLPIVKRIVETHGGRVTVTSHCGPRAGTGPSSPVFDPGAQTRRATGAVFRVELPGERASIGSGRPERVEGRGNQGTGRDALTS
jgi:two-component system sensor histidine kinase PilS (NtrC family)